ncbi:hypothetical protein RI129_003247 [Pyrocoelia pectoralis]|uniref:Uncharacterized protein n=1 Tax=Pyrocoelia pectoralis TaxID=417401 RepID=A0AAN7VGN0_9COLE
MSKRPRGVQKYCDDCSEHVPDYTAHLRSIKHKNNCLSTSVGGIQELKSAFKCRIVSYRVTADHQFINLIEFMAALAGPIKKVVRHQLEVLGCVKANCDLYGYFILEAKGKGEIKAFNTRNHVLTINSDLSKWLEDVTSSFDVQASSFQEKDSGWALQHWLFIEVNINKNSPLWGSTYIPTPPSIARKRAIVNVKNTDVACFGWAIMSAIDTPTGHVELPSSYRHYSEVFNFEGIGLPRKTRCHCQI